MKALAAELPSWTRDSLRAANTLASYLGDQFALVHLHLHRLLPALADAGMALNNLERLAATGILRDKLPALLADGGRRFEDLLHLLDSSQFLADTLIADGDSFDALL